MASKSRGGLSRREVAAQKKVKPKVSTRAAASKSSSKGYSDPTLAAEMNPVGATINPGRQNQPLVINDSGPLQQGQKRSTAKTDNKGSSKSSSSSKAKPVSLTPSTPAQSSETISPYSGTSVGRAARGVVANGLASVKDIFSGLGQMIGNNGLSRASTTDFLTPSESQARINKGLGIHSSLAADVPTGYGDNGEIFYNDYDPAKNGPSLLRSDFATPGTDFSRPGSEDAYRRGVSPVDYGRRQAAAQVNYGASDSPTSRLASSSPTSTTSSQLRTPRAIAGGFSPAPQPVASITPQIMGGLDYTPANEGQPGTNRRFLGNGYLSNGLASNGKLDSEFAGASFGMPTDGMDNLFDEDLINNILGVKTAQAAEMPMGQTDFESSPQLNSFSPYASNMGETAGSAAGRFQSLFGNPVGQNEQTNNTQVQNPGGSQNGGVTQQFAQGATGGDPMDNYYNSQLKGQDKAFSAQEKAQKKALKELLKSIKSQYGTQQSTGLDQLNKSKQEDLLKLSGLFSFANQDPDSEQRIQYEQRANQDYAGQQGDFLAKLAAAQAQEESRARQGYQGEMARIAGQRNDARSKIEELIFNARQQAQKGSGGGRALSGTAAGSVTYMGDNASGEPVYRNNQTGEMQVGSGLTRKSQDPYAQMMASIMGQQQGGQQEQRSTDTDGNPIIFRNGQWEYL